MKKLKTLEKMQKPTFTQEEFKVPIMVRTNVNVNFDLKLENRTESGGGSISPTAN